MAAIAKTMHSDLREPIHCAVVARPTEAEKHKRKLLRNFVLAIAVVAVFLLISIALYYTHGRTIMLVHVSALSPLMDLRV
jgi:hypothetical protein